mgnify:CR=1 FL=1
MEQEKNWLELISETAAYITEKVGEMPKTAIILGTGLGELVKHIDIKVAIPYSEIPNFPRIFFSAAISFAFLMRRWL